MKTLNDTLLIASAPTEILVGLGIFLVIASGIVLLQSSDEGRYPELKRCLIRLRTIRLLPRRVGRGWLVTSAYRPAVRI